MSKERYMNLATWTSYAMNIRSLAKGLIDEIKYLVEYYKRCSEDPSYPEWLCAKVRMKLEDRVDYAQEVSEWIEEQINEGQKVIAWIGNDFEELLKWIDELISTKKTLLATIETATKLLMRSDTSQGGSA
jgi:hypothetical protein